LHKNLQVNENPLDVEVWEAKIRTVLENITAKLMEEQYESMKRQLLEEDIKEALKNSKNNRAAGLDGATYELWKTILRLQPFVFHVWIWAQ
jgi:ribosomal protein L12E/L44/L45/RPP1/RPP2